MAKVVGIDLGTTNSGIAYMEGGTPTIIPNAEGGRITPSVVTITEDGEQIVGEIAKRQAVSKPNRTIRSIKRKMGSTHRDTIDNKDYTPQEISAMILRKLKKDAEDFLGEEIKQAVITCPAYFTDSQRQATKDAGKIAGLDVLRIINEPTAACLAYGVGKEIEETILVFDLGGGTFDVSILETYMEEGDTMFEVKATSGNNLLGGDDFDARIIKWVVEQFKKQEGVDITKNASAMQRIMDASEKAKMELSSKQRAFVDIPYATVDKEGQPININYEITRSQFQRMTEDLIEKTMGPTRQALKDSKKKASEINKVLLVGGATRMPAVREEIAKMFGETKIYKGINPDECVAIGAAIQAGVIKGDVKDVLLLDVTPLTLGIETLGQVFTPIVDRNTTIPTSKSQIFSTASDNQPSVEIHVLQGERKFAKDNVTLGKFQLIGIPPAPRGVPQVEVTFDLDVNGIVSVKAKDLGTGNEQKVTVSSPSGVDKKDVEQMVKDAEQYEEEDNKRLEEVQLKNESEHLVYSVDKVLKDFKDKVTDEETKSIKEKQEELRQALATDDYDDIKKKKETLMEELQQISTRIYQQSGGQPGAGFDPSQFAEGAGPSFTPPGTQGKPEEEHIVDVDYEVEEDEE
ncbi:MAG: molecular chaperone DnaK [Candidatus Heimdallarchaeota archaeon]|nr:molecular chaperone DnaK [Candidatus Heimdallarchaeota archaeon]MBY8994132.1 molecular chaperone DnaK [Candidatus Heimdallarchaeota archaeon]